MQGTIEHPRYPGVVVDLDGSQWEILNRCVLALKRHGVHPGMRDLFIVELMENHGDRDAFIETCRRWITPA